MQVGGQLNAPSALLPEKSRGTHWIEVLGVRSVAMVVLEKRKISCPLRDSNTDPTVHTLVAILTTLPRLLIPYR
jgi:hypothetical protein